MDAHEGVASPRLIRAVEREVERRLAEARATTTIDAPSAWERAIDWASRARAIGANVPPATALDAERRAAETATAARYYEQGREYQYAGRWVDAIEAYGTARSIRRDYSDTSIRMAQSFAALAEADLAAGRYHAALDALVASGAANPSVDAEARAASLRLALARSDLERGFCRAAYDALSVSGEADGADAERARRCARIELVITPASGAPFETMPADRVAAAFDAALVSALRSRASAHVRLRVPDAVTVLADHRIGEIAAPEPLDPAAGIRYEVSVTLRGALDASFRVSEERSGAVAAEGTIPLALDPGRVTTETDPSSPALALLDEVARRWAKRAAEGILEVIDRPIASPDPPKLDLPTLAPVEARPDGAATGEPI